VHDPHAAGDAYGGTKHSFPSTAHWRTHGLTHALTRSIAPSIRKARDAEIRQAERGSSPKKTSRIFVGLSVFVKSERPWRGLMDLEGGEPREDSPLSSLFQPLLPARREDALHLLWLLINGLVPGETSLLTERGHGLNQLIHLRTE
jgi:hypothetical protein